MCVSGDKKMANSNSQQAADAGDFSELAMDEAVERIGQEVLGLETLNTRNSDSLDFSDQAVWTLRAALKAAYKAGQVAATK
jgi:hypothetical protein